MSASQHLLGPALGRQDLERGGEAGQAGNLTKKILLFNPPLISHFAFQAHQHFKFVPTDFDFECSQRGETEVPAESLFYSTDLRSVTPIAVLTGLLMTSHFRVQKDGRLLIFDEKNETIGTYDDTQYCVSFTDRASFLEVEDEDTELALEERCSECFRDQIFKMTLNGAVFGSTYTDVTKRTSEQCLCS